MVQQRLEGQFFFIQSSVKYLLFFSCICVASPRDDLMKAVKRALEWKNCPITAIYDVLSISNGRTRKNLIVKKITPNGRIYKEMDFSFIFFSLFASLQHLKKKNTHTRPSPCGFFFWIDVQLLCEYSLECVYIACQIQSRQYNKKCEKLYKFRSSGICWKYWKCLSWLDTVYFTSHDNQFGMFLLYSVLWMCSANKNWLST